jgi:hypothetical protein
MSPYKLTEDHQFAPESSPSHGCYTLTPDIVAYFTRAFLTQEVKRENECHLQQKS